MKKLLFLLIIPALSFGQNLGFNVVTVDSTYTHSNGCGGISVDITAYQVPSSKVVKVQHTSTNDIKVNGKNINWDCENPLWLDSGDILVIDAYLGSNSWTCSQDCSCPNQQYSFFLSLLEFDK